MIELDASTVLLQWAVGGMLGCWYTTRHREVGLGYGWLLRGTYVLMAVASAYIGFASTSSSSAATVRDVGGVLVAIAIALGLGQSIVRRRAGVSGYIDDHDRRSQRVAEMTGIDRGDSEKETGSGKEFEPLIDLFPVAVGLVALIAAGVSDGGNDALAIVRTLVGAAFLGFVSDAMLLGHWWAARMVLGGLCNHDRSFKCRYFEGSSRTSVFSSDGCHRTDVSRNLDGVRNRSRRSRCACWLARRFIKSYGSTTHELMA